MAEEPMRMRTVKLLAASVAAALAPALTACGGAPVPRAAGSVPASVAATAPREQIPAAFDDTRGWMVQETPDGTGFGRVTLVPRAGLVLLRTLDHGPTRLIARDARTGTDRWSGQPVTIPNATLDARVFVTAREGREYAVLTTTGAAPDNGVDKTSSATHLYVYDTGSSGERIAPLREITVPGTAADEWVQSDGFALVRSGMTVAVADVTTGQVTSYASEDPAITAPRPCGQLIGSCNKLNKVVAMTANGPVVQGFRAFWTPGGWFSDEVVPAGASASHGAATVEVLGSPDGHAVLAAWPTKDAKPTDRVWAVHDSQTGQVEASITCDYRAATTIEPTLSADGRYLLAGSVAFDLQAKKGTCLGETRTRHAIRLIAIDADGTAYGNAMRPSSAGRDDPTPVTVVLATAQATPLAEGTHVPDLIGGGVAVFGTDTAGGERILVYPRH
jgi:hypothetical protein